MAKHHTHIKIPVRVTAVNTNAKKYMTFVQPTKAGEYIAPVENNAHTIDITLSDVNAKGELYGSAVDTGGFRPYGTDVIDTAVRTAKTNRPSVGDNLTVSVPYDAELAKAIQADETLHLVLRSAPETDPYDFEVGAGEVVLTSSGSFLIGSDGERKALTKG